MGFAREVVVAREFGLSTGLDVYIVVAGFYLFLGQQAGNAMEMTLISQWSRWENSGRTGGRLLELAFQVSLFVCILVLSLYIAFDGVFTTLFPALGSQAGGARDVFAALVPAILLAANAGLLRGALNVHRIFAPGIVSGAVVSGSVIVCLFVLPERLGVLAIAHGLALGQGIVVVWFLSLSLKHRVVGAGIADVRRLFHPDRIFWAALATVVAGELVYQVLGLTQRSFASGLGEGMVSAFYYATSLMLVPLALIVTPALTVVYPGMARRLQEDWPAGIALMKQAMLVLSAIGLVAAVSLALLADDIVGIVYVRGAFTTQDAMLTASILKVVVLSLPLMAMARLARYAFYALADYLTPIMGNLLAIAGLLVSASLSIPKYGIVGLAWSIVLSTGISVAFLLSVLYARCRHGQLRDPSL